MSGALREVRASWSAAVPGVEGLADEALALAPRLVAIRRDLHRHPEPGFREFRTAAAVENELGAIGGWKVRRVAGTGVLADLGPSGEAVLLRADMDALELEEHTGLEFASTVPGMMHACGHDAHTAMLLGAARLLAAHASELGHPVRLCFQPCEETSPGGALKMIEEGALDGVAAAFAQHVYPQEEVGTIAVKAGAMMANADDFDVVFRGRSGHAAQPHESRDALLAAARFVEEVQAIVARRVDPFASVVITVGRIEAGTRRNIIAGEAKVEGTIRTLTDAHRVLGRELLERAASASAAVAGVEAELRYMDGYPVVENDAALTGLAEAVGVRLLGPGRVRTLAHPSMGGEDFAYYARRVPGCFYRLGSGGADPETRHGHHSDRFRIDEGCLPVGAAMLAGLALSWRRDETCASPAPEVRP